MFCVFLTVPWIGLQCVILVSPSQIHFLWMPSVHVIGVSRLSSQYSVLCSVFFLIVLFNSLANTITIADTRVNFINGRIHRKYSSAFSVITYWNITQKYGTATQSMTIPTTWTLYTTKTQERPARPRGYTTVFMPNSHELSELFSFSCSTHMSIEFIFINLKMPTIVVGILKFMTRAMP